MIRDQKRFGRQNASSARYFSNELLFLNVDMHGLAMFHCRLKGLKKELEQEFSGPVIGLAELPDADPPRTLPIGEWMKDK